RVITGAALTAASGSPHVKTSRSIGAISMYSPPVGNVSPVASFVIVYRYLPPTRKSTETPSDDTPKGCSQCAISLPSVHAFQTRSWGAEKTRVIENSGTSVLVVMIPSPDCRDGGFWSSSPQ